MLKGIKGLLEALEIIESFAFAIPGVGRGRIEEQSVVISIESLLEALEARESITLCIPLLFSLSLKRLL